MQNAKGSILQNVRPALSKIFVLSIFEWPFNAGFTECVYW